MRARVRAAFHAVQPSSECPRLPARHSASHSRCGFPAAGSVLSPIRAWLTMATITRHECARHGHRPLLVAAGGGRPLGGVERADVLAPAWSDSAERGVVAEGSVGARVLGRFRLFRYEIRLWRQHEEDAPPKYSLVDDLLHLVSTLHSRPPWRRRNAERAHSSHWSWSTPVGQRGRDTRKREASGLSRCPGADL